MLIVSLSDGNLLVCYRIALDTCVHTTVSLIKLGSTEEGQLQVVCTTATYVECLQ